MKNSATAYSAESSGPSADTWEQPALAPRLRKPGWRDPRLIFGLVLLAMGVGLGSLVVNAASNTVTVYAAGLPLIAGTALEPGNLVTKEVRVPDHEKHYLTPGVADAQWWEDEPSITRSVDSGELLPLSALSKEPETNLRPVTVSLASASEPDLNVGTVVDLWHVSDHNSSEPPRILAEELQVSAVSQDSGPLSVSGSKAVTVLVPLEEIKTVLGAKSGAGAIEVVPHMGRWEP